MILFFFSQIFLDQIQESDFQRMLLDVFLGETCRRHLMAGSCLT